MDPTKLIEKAQGSSFYLRLLNISLARIIPFNKPHRIRIMNITNEGIRICLPYRRTNLNHIRGLHACGLATLSEYTTGLSLLRNLDMKKYRIIMKEIRMEYHYQGKKDAFAEFSVSPEWLTSHVHTPLETSEKTDVPVEIKVKDSDGTHLATGHITWQIKDWEKVKTNV